MNTQEIPLNKMLKIESRSNEVTIVNLQGDVSEFWFDTRKDVDDLINQLVAARDKTFGREYGNYPTCPDCGAALKVNLEFVSHAS